MVSPIHSTSATIHNTLTSPSSPATPIGIGSQPSTLSRTDSLPLDYWKSIKTGFQSFIDFIRDITIKMLEGMRSGLGHLIEWIDNKSIENASSATLIDWQLPIEIQPSSPSAGVSEDLFNGLPINDQDRQKIYTLIHTMGTSGWMTLLRQKATLEQLGREINHVHPLKFLEYILKHPLLKKDLENLSNGPFTWRPFIAGISEKMQRELATLAGCKNGLARSLNLNSADIDPYFVRADWEGFVKFLIDVKNGRKISVWVEPVIVSTTNLSLPAAVTLSNDSVLTRTALVTSTLAPRLADLPFEKEDEETLISLISSYAHKYRWRLLLEYRSLSSQWSRLGRRHPLKILTYLYSNPALMAHLGTIFQYYGTKILFLTALKNQLSATPSNQVYPHLDEFSQVCNLDLNVVKQQVQNGQWNQLLEDLHCNFSI